MFLVSKEPIVLFHKLGTSYLHEAIQSQVENVFKESENNFVLRKKLGKNEGLSDDDLKDVIDLRNIRINCEEISESILKYRNSINFINSANRNLNRILQVNKNIDSRKEKLDKFKVLYVPTSSLEVCYLDSDGNIKYNARGQMVSDIDSPKDKDGCTKVLYYKYFAEKINARVKDSTLDRNVLVKMRADKDGGSLRFSLLITILTLVSSYGIRVDMNGNSRHVFRELLDLVQIDRNIPRLRYYILYGGATVLRIDAKGTEGMNLHENSINYDTTGKFNKFYSYSNNIYVERQYLFDECVVMPAELFDVSSKSWNKNKEIEITMDDGTVVTYDNDLYQLREKLRVNIDIVKKYEKEKDIPEGFRELTGGKF